jgi:hypothetical protein
MVCGTFTITQIAAEDVDGVIARYKANKPPPVSVTKTKAPDGTWTVTATFPPCPPNTSHSTGNQ